MAKCRSLKMENNMKAHFLLIALLSLPAAAAPVDLVHPVECTLSAVAAKMRVTLRADVPPPQVFLESKIPLAQFQDAVEPQWLFRPEIVLNSFIEQRNEIYLKDEGAIYAKNKRFLDDSLAHELAHYIQVKYQKAVSGSADDYLERDAVMVQTWFRETYMETGQSPCGK